MRTPIVKHDLMFWAERAVGHAPAPPKEWSKISREAVRAELDSKPQELAMIQLQWEDPLQLTGQRIFLEQLAAVWKEGKRSDPVNRQSSSLAQF